ncbi:hypothetical protein CANARDRAFT_21603 [[Candida] arabinofermentans NRRL YB-2248]|uniref:Mitochondrial glycine transporter n=1 Tax=[Candida] arabinofermentans NRRL YB-2248 TaxID=983967 RepID=A0A1E4T4D3_9ASCO|nr:hypothetical protein CANARDRAFT_21603 [[Candida] arabinofermentans NRRL YB-2248]
MTTNRKTTRHLVAGFSGGLTSAIALQPLDLVKTRLQQSSETRSIRAVYNSLSSFKTLWRGTLPSALRTSIGSGLYLSSLNAIRTSIANLRHPISGATIQSSSKLPKLSPPEDLFAGMFARGLVGFITMPITVLKVRFESDLYNYSSLTQASKNIYRTEGISGFFRGFGATALRDAPYAGLYILFYQKFKVIFPVILRLGKEGDSNEKLFNTSTSAIINASAAISSASVATAITAPFDTIKTNMQLNPAKYSSFKKATLLIVNDHWTRLFDGLSLRLVRKAFSAAIAWGIYEELIKL